VTVWWLARGVRDVPSDRDWLSAAEAGRAVTMTYTKRRTEFLAARFTAKHTMARILDRGTDPATLATLEIHHHPTGAPYPVVDGVAAPLSLSLTDRADWAVCAIGAAGTSLGCDLEIVEPRSSAFVRDYLTPAEQRIVAASADLDLAANLLWSAKESALKVLQTGLRRDTRSVEVRLGDDRADGWSALTVHPTEGGCLPGWWRRFGAFVLTVAASDPIDPPRALEDPDPLATAVPTHAWLDGPVS
jgi:4'-phosphopantetheinyl transferase